MKYDFKGWATKYNVLCSDGRTILPGAFKDQDGARVPLVWGHIHDDPTAVLGYAVLQHRDEGVYTYGCFNDSEQGRNAKLLVDHGDIDSVSICANKLEPKRSSEVRHGKIRELSLVLSGANEGARIEPVLVHGEDSDEVSELIIYSDDEIELNHDDEDMPEIVEHSEKGNETMADEKKTEEKKSDDRTVQDVINTMNEEQRNVLYALVGEALEAAPEKNEEEDSKEMKHNVFETTDDTVTTGTVLNHSAFETIKSNAKRAGSFRDAYNDYLDELRHDDEPSDEPVSYVDREGHEINYNLDRNGNPYFIGNYNYLFPDPRLVGDKPAMIERDQTWVSIVMNGVKHSPFSRIKTLAADITEDDARAKGYLKGHMKKEEFFGLMKRVTTPTTIYKKQKMDRDDLLDISDWDVVAWLKGEMTKMLNEEKARAILVGDGRQPGSEDKVNADCIRPIASDTSLYTVQVNINNSGYESTGIKARDFINAVIWNRKNYKGSGTPMLFTTEDMLTECLMLTDEIGRDLYENEQKLATKLRVSRIVTVPSEIIGDTIVGIMVNLNDYTVGADKGHASNFLEDFDIDYNQQKYLIEDRMSGALTKPYSAMVFSDTEVTNNG